MNKINKNTLILFIFALFFLSGCNETLYDNLPEKEGNEMLAILLLNNINASKTEGKNGGITISVAKSDFVNAVEYLRQKGYPKKPNTDINTMFPSGQLVTSPDQEQAKLNFLKEQRLEEMYLSMNGVIDSKVNISMGEKNDMDGQVTNPSISILITYSPMQNIREYRQKIIDLAYKSVTGVNINNISLLLIPTSYQYKSSIKQTSSSNNKLGNAILIGISFVTFGLLLTSILFYVSTRNKRKEQR